MNHNVYIRVAQAVSDRLGKFDSSEPVKMNHFKKVYKDRLVTVTERGNPRELVIKTGFEVVLHLHGANLLHFDENKTVFEHLVKLLPGDGALLEIIAATD